MPPPARRQRPGETAHTARVIVVVRASLRDDANQAARAADPTTVGDTFDVPYRRASDTTPDPEPVAYIADWAMTPGQQAHLRAEFARRGARPVDVIPPGGDPAPDPPYAVFDAAFGISNVLDALGLARIPTGTPA